LRLRWGALAARRTLVRSGRIRKFSPVKRQSLRIKAKFQKRRTLIIDFADMFRAEAL